jgi:steroid 5-alpha reductase family enzyme
MPNDLTWAGVWFAIPLVFAYMTAWFVVALLAKRNDLADLAWGLGFIVIVVGALARAGAPTSPRLAVVGALVTVWGLRLAWHIARRNLRPGHAEDPRYAAWRREWGRWFVLRSYLQVFLLLGLFMLLISTPVLMTGTDAVTPLGILDVVGIAIWIGGFAFESVGDAQLARFLGDPANKGHIMDRGLWAWTRHPNYFGEATMWWGLAVMALAVPAGWIGMIGPITITWLLTMVSGVPLAEASLAGNPEWEAYKARTSVFLPLPPRKG